MEYQICFCKDGIMRLKHSEKPMVPLSFIQKKYKNKSDFSFWSIWWNCETMFEDGLTVGDFFSCLQPWAEFWSDFTHKDILSFIKESKKPLLIKNQSNRADLSWISLSYFFDMDLELEYQREISDMTDLNKWLNQKRLARLTGDWNINGYYKLTGYKDDVIEHYSIEHSPMNELVNVPLILNNKQIILFQDFNSKEILGKKAGLFKDNAFGVRKAKINSEYGNFVYLHAQGKKTHSLKDVIQGFFFWFPENPVMREEFNESLRLSLKDNDEQLTDDNNVIPLFKKDLNVKSKKSGKKIKVAPGAFDSLIESLNSSNEFWDDLLKLASNDKNVVLKIGDLKEAKVPEKRIYGYIVKDEDLSTPYKKI